MFEELTLASVLDRSGGSIKTGPFGTVLRAEEYSNHGTPVISVGEVGYGALRINPKTPRVTSDVTDRLSGYVLRHGDIVFGRKGGVDRSAWVRPTEADYFLGSDAIRVRFGNGVESRFMAYQLQTSFARDWLLRHAAGSTMASMNEKILGRLPVRLPQLSEQRAIAEVLGALDDKIAANARLIGTADELAASLTRQALDQTTARLIELASITMGSSPPGESYNEEGQGVVFYQGVRDFGVRSPTNRVWTTSPVRVGECDDTLLSVRAPVGRTNLATETTCLGRGIAAVRSREARAMTLFHLLRDSPGIWTPFEAEGTVFGSINKGQLETLRIPRVRSDQAQDLEFKLGALESRIAAALVESAGLARTRDALLPLLMSGRLRVKDAEQAVSDVT